MPESSQGEAYPHPPVNKAIIAAAGKGTRMLPWTVGENPKEALWAAGLPIFDWVMKDLDEAGVPGDARAVVINDSKKSIQSYYQHHAESVEVAKTKGHKRIEADLERIASYSIWWKFQTHRQPSGNARPILDALSLINDEPFFALFGDEYFEAKPSRTAQMQEAYQRMGKTIVALMKVERTMSVHYGMADIESEVVPGKIFRLKGLVEKPRPEDAPSDYAGVGGYILAPEIIPILKQEKPGVGGEIVIADSINELAQSGEVYGCVIEGEYYDTGTELAYQKTLASQGVNHPEYGQAYLDHLHKLVEKRYNE